MESCVVYLFFVNLCAKWCYKHIVNPFISYLQTSSIVCELSFEITNKKKFPTKLPQHVWNKLNKSSGCIIGRSTCGSHGTITCWSIFASTNFKQWFWASWMSFKMCKSCKITSKRNGDGWKWEGILGSLWFFNPCVGMRWIYYCRICCF